MAISLSKLDEGSEHIVYLAPSGSEVLKLTRPGTYGDHYFLRNDRVHQQCSTPGEYFLRLQMLQDHFGFAPVACGITSEGQIVSRQKFVQGDPPTQDEVDDFLLAAAIEPVRRSCWLWKKADPESEVEYWIGDARADNFVKTSNGIVPIDLRMWGVGVPRE